MAYNDDFEQDEDTRELIRLLKMTDPARGLRMSPELHNKIMQQFDEHEARRRFLWFPAMVNLPLRGLARNVYRRFFGARPWNHPMENPASIISSATPAASAEYKSLSVPENRGIILRCLYENWPNEVSMIGDNLVSRIVDEVLAGNKPVLQVPQGGFSFDLTPYIDTILNATILLLSMEQLYRVRHIQPHNTPNASDEGEPPDRPEETEENVEELVRILTQYLTEERAMERREATKLARMFIRVSSGGSQA